MGSRNLRRFTEYEYPPVQVVALASCPRTVTSMTKTQNIMNIMDVRDHEERLLAERHGALVNKLLAAFPHRVDPYDVHIDADGVARAVFEEPSGSAPEFAGRNPSSVDVLPVMPPPRTVRIGLGVPVCDS